MRTNNKRSILMALAFSVTAAGGLTGLSLTGHTSESSLDQACSHATWPMIPNQCLSGADNDRTVRAVATRTAIEQPESMAQRFALAFN
jgi:hypothetical protein